MKGLEKYRHQQPLLTNGCSLVTVPGCTFHTKRMTLLKLLGTRVHLVLHGVHMMHSAQSFYIPPEAKIRICYTFVAVKSGSIICS